MENKENKEPVKKVFNTTENYNRYTITDILGLGKIFDGGNGLWLIIAVLTVIGWSMGKC